MKDERDRQLEVTDFFDEGEYQSLTPEEKRKQRLRGMAKRHLMESIRLLLESLDRNSIELARVWGFFMKVLRKMEEHEICYLKGMPDEKMRIFKKVYCCFEVDVWKTCPEYRCLVWPCDGTTQCQHFSLEEDEPLIESRRAR